MSISNVGPPVMPALAPVAANLSADGVSRELVETVLAARPSLQRAQVDAAQSLDAVQSSSETSRLDAYL